MLYQQSGDEKLPHTGWYGKAIAMKRMKDDTAALSKRQWPRLNPESIPFLKGITLNQGNEAHVVDISRGGALIETDVRLRPQMKIVFKVLTTQGTFRITGSVLRSSIKSLQGTPIYQSAIVFENPLTMLDDLEPQSAGIDANTADATETEAMNTASETAEAEEPKIETISENGEDVFIESGPKNVTETSSLTMRELTVDEQPMATVSRSVAARSVYETPDIFESALPPQSSTAAVAAEPVLRAAERNEDELILNVIAPDGFGVSFDNSDSINDW